MVAVPVGSLIDTFTGPLSAYWTSPYGGATASGGYATIPCTHTGGTPNYAGLLSTQPSVGNTWTMFTTAGFVEMVQVPVAGGAGVCYCQLSILSPTSGTYLSVLYDAVSGNLSFGNYIGFADGALVVIPHVPALHRWWRIRHAVGRIYWETSPDATTWTIRRTLIGAPAWVTSSAVSVQLDASRNGGTSDQALFDNFNVSSVNVTVTPATVSITTTIPAPGPSAGSTATPSSVTTSTAIPAPSISLGTTPTPNSVDTTISIPTPQAQAGTTVSPDPVDLSISIPTPSIAVGATAIAAPPGVTLIRSPLAQVVISTQSGVPPCSGTATVLTLSGAATPLSLSGTAIVI